MIGIIVPVYDSDDKKFMGYTLLTAERLVSSAIENEVDEKTFKYNLKLFRKTSKSSWHDKNKFCKAALKLYKKKHYEATRNEHNN